MLKTRVEATGKFFRSSQFLSFPLCVLSKKIKRDLTVKKNSKKSTKIFATSMLQKQLFCLIVIYTSVSCQSLVYSQVGIGSRVMKKIEMVKKSVTPIAFHGGAPIWYNDEIYCVNFNNQSIDVIDPDKYTIKRQIGRQGPGPGEFQIISSYTVDKYGVSVVDGGRLTITEFDHQGKIRTFYKHPQQMLNALRMAASSQYLIKPILPLDGNKERFDVVNIDTKSSQSIYAVSQLFSRHPDMMMASLQTIYLEGPMTKNNAGHIFRVPWLCSEFIAFDDKSGRVLYGRQTIDKTTIQTARPPSSKQREDSKTTTTMSLGKMRRINLSAAANSRYLFVLSNAPSPLIKDISTNWTDERVVDAYNVKNGDYAFSFIMPKHNGRRAKELSMTEDTFCVFYEDEIVRYQVRLP